MMNAKILAAAAALSLCVAGPALAECTATSTPPSIPNGSGATADQMAATSKSVKGYIADMQDFLKCLEFQNAGGSPKYAAAVDQIQNVANEFNKQLRAFKAKS